MFICATYQMSLGSLDLLQCCLAVFESSFYGNAFLMA